MHSPTLLLTKGFLSNATIEDSGSRELNHTLTTAGWEPDALVHSATNQSNSASMMSNPDFFSFVFGYNAVFNYLLPVIQDIELLPGGNYRYQSQWQPTWNFIVLTILAQNVASKHACVFCKFFIQTSVMYGKYKYSENVCMRWGAGFIHNLFLDLRPKFTPILNNLF